MNQLYTKELGIFMYKYHKHLLPRSFDNIFTNMKSIHNYDTRGKDNYRAEVHRLNDVYFTLSVLLIGPWLPTHVHVIFKTNKHVFIWLTPASL